MLNHSPFLFRCAALVCLAFSMAPAGAQAAKVVLFQPGQSSWEWLLVPSLHSGGSDMRKGKDCLTCHAGEEKAIGNLVAAGEKLEPEPIAGLPGFIEMTVDAAYDDENLYLTLSWAELPAAIRGDADAGAQVTVSLGTPELNVAPVAGCWAACHSDLPEMPDVAGEDLTKYLPGSRNKMTRTGGGADIKPEADLDAMLADGQYLELWQAELSGGDLVSARDGYILERQAFTPDSVVSANVVANGQRTTLELMRPLKPEGLARHSLSEDEPYTLNIALNGNRVSGRRHYTSLPMRLLLGPGEAELNAARR